MLHPIGILVSVGILALLVWLLIKMKRSPKFDKFCKDLTEDVTPNPPSTTEVIKSINQEKDGLKKKAEDNTKVVEKLQKDSTKIDNYLGKKKKKKKEGSG